MSRAATFSAHPRRDWRQALATGLTRLVLLLASAATVVPVLWVVVSSLGRGSSLYSDTLIPPTLTLGHYRELLGQTAFLTWLKNSAVVCAGGSLLALVLTVNMAYAFSRFRFWGRRYGLLVLLLTQMLPSTVTIVAIYRLLQMLHLLNTFAGLVMIYGGTTIPFNAWLMRGYFDGIPLALEESAYIDGASHFLAFLRITLPLAVPMAAVIFLFNLITFYSDYVLCSIVLSGKENYTVALGMRFFQEPYAANWAMFAAASVLASVPIAIVFYALQRYLVEGLTRGALKG